MSSPDTPSAALIECILKRPGGSHVEMPVPGRDGEIEYMTYHFAPDQTGAHVAVVENMNHITRFMQIPEGYRILRLMNLPAAAAPAPVMGAAAVPGPVTETAPVAVQVAPAAPAAQPTAPTALPEAGANGQFTEEQVAALRAAFKAELGRDPHPKAKAETMIAQIEATRKARSGEAA
jgi:hypothetical protein